LQIKILMEVTNICPIVDYYCLTKITSPTNDNFVAAQIVQFVGGNFK